MRKKFKIVLAVAFLFLGGLWAGLARSDLAVSAADVSVHTQTLRIVKYGLTPGSSGFVEDQTKNDGTPINNLPTDNQGNDLEPLAGISYVIQEIRPNDAANFDLTAPDADTYQTIGRAQTVVTDSQGEASIVLPDGIYLVSEQANPDAGLSTAAEPVVVQLPQWKPDGSSMLNPVYLYPKSSLDGGSNGGGHPTPIPPKGGDNGGKTGNGNSGGSSGKTGGNNTGGSPTPIGNQTGTGENHVLPKTGDGGASELSWAGVLLVGLIGLWLSRKKLVK